MVNPYAGLTFNTNFSTAYEFNDLLIDIENTQSFDDVIVTGARQIVVKSKGEVHRLKPVVSPSSIEVIVNHIGGGQNVYGDIKAQKLFEPSYQITDEKAGKVYRYRVASAACSGGRSKQVQVVLRSISSVIPSLEFTKLDQSDYEHIVSGPGLVIISGETGSGKTTTMASIIGELIRRDHERPRHKVIKTYEQPVEYLFDGLVKEQVNAYGDCSIEITQHEIGLDIATFEDALKNALRSNPDIIILGEAREYTTIRFALQMAMSGHLVFITTHAKGVLNTVNRLVSSFPEALQSSARSMFTTSTKMIISQQLIPGVDSQVPLRETLKINDSDQRHFGSVASDSLQNTFAHFFGERGQNFYQHATELHSNGLITDEGLKMIQLLESGK